ncbi:unnamed protein product [Victoria cruziana]
MAEAAKSKYCSRVN